MNFYERPLPPKYDKSLKGVKDFAVDWINTPHTTERIVPAWPLDILCGLVFLTLPFLIHFFGA